MKKRYIVYVEVPDDGMCIKYGYRHFKFTAWLLVREAKKTWNDLITIIVDRKKGEIIYEKIRRKHPNL